MVSVGHARVLRKRSTSPERRVWLWLRRHNLGGFKFRRQHPVNGYVLDFYCPELKLCVEIDGSGHDLYAQAMHDLDRSAALSRQDIVVLRIRNEEVLKRPDAAWDAIVGAVVRIVREQTGEDDQTVLRRLFGAPQR